MVDANYAMSVDQAIAAAERFKPFNICWFGLPIRTTDGRRGKKAMPP